jgi:hypothetical protein
LKLSEEVLAPSPVPSPSLPLLAGGADPVLLSIAPRYTAATPPPLRGRPGGGLGDHHTLAEARSIA